MIGIDNLAINDEAIDIFPLEYFELLYPAPLKLEFQSLFQKVEFLVLGREVAAVQVDGFAIVMNLTPLAVVFYLCYQIEGLLFLVPFLEVLDHFVRSFRRSADHGLERYIHNDLTFSSNSVPKYVPFKLLDR